MKVNEIKVIKDLDLGIGIIKSGKTVTAVKVNNDWYKLFHRSGWWKVPVEYFEKTITKKRGQYDKTKK